LCYKDSDFVSRYAKAARLYAFIYAFLRIWL